LGLAVVGVLGVLAERKTRVVFKPKHPTHKIVCSCGCFPHGETDGERQTFEERSDCGTLNDVNCTTSEGKSGTLSGCRKRAVETSLVPERVISGVGPVIERRM
jgi:hypothetical protein